MKKILAILLAAMMLFSVVACVGNNDVDEPNTDNNDETTGDETTGDETTGDETTGDETTGDETTGDETTDDETTGDETTGDETTGDETTGDETTGDETTGDETTELAYNSAAELLTMIWNAFADEEKFSVAGGDYEHMVMDAPGKFHLDCSEPADALNGMTHYPVAAFDKLTDAATIMHGMMANNFTCGAFRFANAEDAAAMTETLKNLYPTVQWRCGFPEKYTIITVPGNYVIAAFGLGEYCIDPLIAHATEAIDGAVVVVDQILE